MQNAQAKPAFPETLKEPPAGQAKPPAPGWTTKKVLQHKPQYDLDVEYPQLAGGSANSDINKKIKSIVDSNIKKGKRDLSLGQIKGKATTRGYINGSYSIMVCSPQVVSVRFNFSGYAPDAAHSIDWTCCFNYSTKSKSLITLDDVFDKNVDYEYVLSVLGTHGLLLSSSSYDLTWLGNGAGPDEKNFNRFAITKQGLELYFDEYQVAPYGQGRSTVKIPYATVRQLLAQDSPVIPLAFKARPAVYDIVLRPQNLMRQLSIIAIGDYSRLISDEPFNGLAYFKRGTWYHILGRGDVARDDYLKAKGLGFDSPELTALLVDTRYSEQGL